MRWFARPDTDPLQLRVAPRLASWNKADHPDQIRLRAYLDDTEKLVTDSQVDGPWALRLDVGLPSERSLLDAGDLDNYAYPLASRLQDPNLVSVWCTKQHHDHSSVRIGAAREVPEPVETNDRRARPSAGSHSPRPGLAPPRRQNHRTRHALHRRSRSGQPGPGGRPCFTRPHDGKSGQRSRRFPAADQRGR